VTDSKPTPTHAALGRFRLTGAPLRAAPSALAAQWRGAVASLFPASPAFHGHDAAHTHTLARYPEVHYRWIADAPALFAIGPAAQQAMAHPWLGAGIRLGEHDLRIAQVDWTVSALERSFSRRLLRYQLGAPWIALNQENHARYRAFDEPARRAEIDRILVGNLLTMSQAFGWFYEPDETVFAAFEPEGEVPCVVKDVSLLGFTGSFVTNLDLPDDLAIGRSVSHGFGWFRAARRAADG
jgi:hypothetical protein